MATGEGGFETGTGAGGTVGARGLLGLYLAANALATTGMIAAVTISAIAAERMLGASTWSAVPVACSILGTAAGSTLVARLLEGRSQRRALSLQYAIATLGAVLAVVAVARGSFLLLALGVTVLGLGNGASQYVRYLAADIVPPRWRARALSWVVWMGSVGAVAGPSLLAPSGRFAVGRGLAEESGAYLAAACAFALVSALYLVAMRPLRGSHAAGRDHLPEIAVVPTLRPTRRRWPAGARLALAAMIIGHVVMVFVMTMTPVHLTGAGHGLGAVGFVISSHVAGMFLLSPLVGWCTDRWGSWSVLVAGACLLGSACLLAALAASPAASTFRPPMALPLFLLGLGWNCGFVAGSSLLTSRLPEPDRIRGRAFADTCVWIAAAGSSLLSGVLFQAIGFDRLGWVGFALSVGLLGLVASTRRHAGPQEAVAGG